MRMQEPEPFQPFEATGTTGQEYGTYRSEAGDDEQQKIYPRETLESRVSGTSILTIIFSSIGLGSAIVGIVGSSIVLANRNGLPDLLAGGILGLAGSIGALLFFVTIFVLSIVSTVRRAARYRRSRIRRE